MVLRGLISGLGLGIIGAILPLTLFSGEGQTLEPIQQAAKIGLWTLILLAVSKLFATFLLLATGWKGGYVFPIMFAGIALGMAGALVATLRAPIFSEFFTLALVQAQTVPVVAVAVLISLRLVIFLDLSQTRKTNNKERAQRSRT